MIRPRLHRCVNALLAAIYLIVGATGGSLHYLIESPTPTARADEQLAGAFFHDHGDGHWHHHGFHRHDRAAVPGQASREQAAGEPTACLDELRRHDHSTLLLAIASAIELSLLEGSSAAEPLAADPRVGVGDDGVAEPTVLAGLGARGPPANGLA